MARVVPQIQHVNGSATTTAAEVSFMTDRDAASRKTEWVGFHNTDTTADLLVSFDGGTTYWTIGAGGKEFYEVNIASVYLKSSTGTVAYEILVGVGI